MELPAAPAGYAASAASGEGFAVLWRKSLAAHAPFFGLIAVYVAGYLAAVGLVPGLRPANFLVMAASFLALSVPMMIASLAILRFYHVARHLRPQWPAAALLADMKACLGDRRRLAHGLPMVAAMLLFMYAFIAIKANLPAFQPFVWDGWLADLDARLHFGRQPWEWLQPVLGHPPLTFLINLNYNVWFVVMWTVWVHFAFAPAASLIRTRFFATFFLSWIIGGSLLAAGFSSAGPCYFGRLGLSPDPFAGLMTYLHQAGESVTLWALPIQERLWQGYLVGSSFDGISAMPSMHNGAAILFALAVSPLNRTIGRLLWAHAALVFVGSVHLGWHYAIDAYAAFALTCVLWLASAPLARWWHDGAAQRALDLALHQGESPT